jgi:hypothetical protein
MSIAFEELEGSPVIRVSEQGTVADRVFRVAWDDWPAFARLLVGSYETAASSFVFVPPMEFPGLPNLVVAELVVEPLDRGHPRGDAVTALHSGTNAYPHGGAKVTARYRTSFDVAGPSHPQLPAIPPGTYLTYSAELGSELRVLPGRVWHWNASPDNPPLSPDQNPALVTPTASYRLAWRRVALPPWSAIRGLRGKVNDATFLGAPAGTVLFLGATVERMFQFQETGGFWTIAYAFSERTVELSTGAKVGWNYQYKEQPVSGQHWVSIADDSGNPPYLSGNLTQLFQFGL